MGGHAHKSPSQAKRMHRCAGALAYVDSLPPEDKAGAGMAAAMGTAAHHLLETCLRKQTPPEMYAGRIILLVVDSDGDATGCSILKEGAKTPAADRVWFEVDDVMVDGVGLAYSYVMRRCEEMRIEPKTLKLEARTNPVPERDDTQGTADVSLDAWPVLEVVDYKNGYVLVEHEDNEQLLSYLAGRAHDTGWEHEEYLITVVQPNSFHDEGRVRTHHVTAEQLRAFVDKHRAACERADVAEDAFATTPFAEWADQYLVAGEHCADTMCDGRMKCPAHKAWLKARSGSDFDDVPLPEDQAPVPTSADEAAKVLSWAPYLEAQIRLAKGFAAAALKAGKGDGRLKFIRLRGKRELRTDLGTPFEVASMLVKDGIISDNERALLWTEPTMKTGPQIEGLIKGKGATARKAKFASDYLTYKPGGLKVVPADAPGEAVAVSAGDDFEEVEDVYN